MAIFCDHCGNEVPDGTVFCTFCGRRLRTEADRIAEEERQKKAQEERRRQEEELHRQEEEQRRRQEEEKRKRQEEVRRRQERENLRNRQHNTRKAGNSDSAASKYLKFAIAFFAAAVLLLLVMVVLPDALGPGKPSAGTFSSGSSQQADTDTPQEEETGGEDAEDGEADEQGPGSRQLLEQLNENVMESIIQSAASPSRYAVCVMDPQGEDSPYVGINQYNSMSASALIDIPILYAVAVKVDSGEYSLNNKVRFRYTVGGRGELTKDDDGRELTLKDLIRCMMQYSDNNATNTLIDYIGMRAITDICRSYGYDSVSVGGKIMQTQDYSDNDNYVSAYDVCGMLSDLYSGRFIGIGRDFLESYMTIRDSAAREGLGNRIRDKRFMNLNGLKEKKYNEAAIIADDSSTYIVVFMASGSKLEQLKQAAAELGEYIEDHIQYIY